jgi:DNA-binding transcriptional MerR regulator
MLPPETFWTLDELVAQAERALANGAAGADDGRVREVPDRRTVRYYTTLGLLDRPAEMRGRTGLYGRKHLLQLVAVKRLQARGLALAEIQQRLLGLTERELAPLAGVSEEAPAAGRRRRSAARGDEAFWTAPPAAPAPAAAPEEPAAAMLQGVRLGPDSTLLLEARRALRDDDLEAIRAAAGPLLDLLRTRGLLEEGRMTKHE